MRYKEPVLKRLEYIKNKIDNLDRLIEGKKVDASHTREELQHISDTLGDVEGFINKEDQNYATLGQGYDNEGRV